MVRYLAGIAMLCACDAHLGSIQNEIAGAEAGVDGASPPVLDAPTDAMMIDAPLGPFGSATLITQAGTTTENIDDPTLTSDGLDLIYAIQPNGASTKKLYEMHRSTTATSDWSAPVQRSELNGAGASQESPRFAYGDDNTLYFGGSGDIYMATRSAVGDAFGAPTKLTNTNINTANYEKWLATCEGGNIMVSRANGTSGQDLYEGTLTAGATINDTVLNSTSDEISTFLSEDCLTAYFASSRSGQTQIYYSTRAAVGSAWAAPTMAPSPFSSAEASDNEDPWLSNDQHIFLLSSIRGGLTTKQLYISTR